MAVFKPGYLDATQASALNDMAAQMSRFASVLITPSVGEVPLIKFPAKITAVDGSTPEKYSWTEQFYTSAGVYIDKINGRVGTTTDMWAYERNGNVTAVFPFYAEMTQRCRVDSTVVFEFDDPSAGNSCGTSVTNVCPTQMFLEQDEDQIIYLDGIQVGMGTSGHYITTELNVETTDCATGDKTCRANPDDCCDGVVTTCCPDDELPGILYLTFSNLTGSCVGCVPLTPIPLVWDGEGAYKSVDCIHLPNCSDIESPGGDNVECFILYCAGFIPDRWILTGIEHINFNTIDVETEVSDMSCNPFLIEGTTPEFHLCNYLTDGGPGSADFTITE